MGDAFIKQKGVDRLVIKNVTIQHNF